MNEFKDESFATIRGTVWKDNPLSFKDGKMVAFKIRTERDDLSGFYDVHEIQVLPKLKREYVLNEIEEGDFVEVKGNIESFVNRYDSTKSVYIQAKNVSLIKKYYERSWDD